MPHITRGLSDDRIRPPSFCLALASLAPPQANCNASCAVNHTLPSDVVPTLTAPTRVPEIIPKSTSAILSTSHTLLVTDAAAATPPDMASTTMEADSTARAHKKQRRSDMRGAQHADATQQTSAKINRRVPDKTHTRQPAPAHCGVRTGANGRRVRAPPPRAHTAPIRARAHATQRAAAPRAHPPPWAGSPGRFRASPASPGDGSDASVVSRRFHCVHFQPMAALLARNPLRIHPETFHFPY